MNDYLTRAELLEMICPTSATYECCQGDCSTSCDKCEGVMNYLLDRYDQTIRADEREKAIDEFVEYVKQYMRWSEESYQKVIGEFDFEEYTIAFKNRLKEQRNVGS